MSELRLNDNLREVQSSSEVTKASKPRKAARFLAKMGLATGLVAASLGEGLLLASVVPTEVPFGNSQARVTTTFDGKVTAEAGVIGSFRRPIEEPFKLGPVELGGNLEIGEVAQPPFKEREMSNSEVSLDKIIGGVDERTIKYYGELYRSSSRDQPEIVDDVKKHILKLSLLAGGFNVGLVVVGASLGKEGRRKLLGNPGTYLSAVALSSIVIVGTPSKPDHDWQPSSSEFTGSEMENVEISGGIANFAVNKIGKEVIQYIQETDEFYKKANESAGEALKERWLISDEYRLETDVDLLLFYTDNHCNPGTPSVMANVAKRMGVKIAADAGDTTASGTKFEDLCVKTTLEAFSDSRVSVVQAPGNHDSGVTNEQMTERGARVLSGSVIRLGGVNFLGNSDPRASRIGIQIQSISAASLEDIGEELKSEACQQEEPPIIVVHDKEAAFSAIESGCVKLALTGHTHKQELLSCTLPDGSKTYVLNGGSSGGAKENQFTYGKLQNPAKFMVVAVKNGELVAFQDFTIDTAGNFEVGDITKAAD